MDNSSRHLSCVGHVSLGKRCPLAGCGMKRKGWIEAIFYYTNRRIKAPLLKRKRELKVPRMAINHLFERTFYIYSIPTCTKKPLANLLAALLLVASPTASSITAVARFHVLISLRARTSTKWGGARPETTCSWLYLLDSGAVRWNVGGCGCGSYSKNNRNRGETHFSGIV